MGGLVEAIKSLGMARLLIMGAIVAAMVGFFTYLTTHVSKPEMALLYSDLDVSDAARMVTKIEEMGLPVDARGDGTQVFVPSDQVGRIRMAMAEQGLPSGGSIGYEIFDKGDALGATGFTQEINHLRALEGELARTIRAINNIAAARVHLVMPKRELFAREAMEPSASIILKMRGSMRLTENNARAIQHLVASAVPGLVPGRISIVDDKGTLVARGSEAADAAASNSEGGLDGGDNESLRIAYESRIARSIESLLERSLGPGKVRTEVSADMDFERLTENSEIFDPNGQVVRSTQTTTDDSNSSDKGKGGQASTVQNEIPGGSAGAAGGESSNSTSNKRNEEVVNYEISKTIKTHVKENGGVKRLSVAVLVDGATTKAKDGKETYTARTKEEMDQITKLVKTAIGFKQDRGDTVEVINMKFAGVEDLPDTAGAPDLIMGFDRGQIVRLLEVVIVAIVGLLSLLMVIKPLFNKLLDGPKTSNANASPAITDQRLAQQMNGQALPSPNNVVQMNQQVAQEVEQMVRLQNVEGQMRASMIKQVAEMVDDKPDEAVTVIRNWMNEGKM